jgi:hypothetical protein
LPAKGHHREKLFRPITGLAEYSAG